jgi:predicted transposase/invertase (TIGR01784 family)
MKTDALYLNLFETTASLALRLAGYDSERGNEYTCTSGELKRSFRVDVVLTPPPESDLPLVLAEVQFQPNPDIYDRLVASYAIARLQRGTEYRSVRMVLFFKNRSVDTGAEVWQPMVESGTLHVVYLDEATEQIAEDLSTTSLEEHITSLLARLTVTPENRQTDSVVVQALRGAVVSLASPERRRFFTELFVNLFFSKYRTLSTEEIRAMIDTREIFDDIGESRAVQEYAEEYAQKQRAKTTIANAVALVRAGINLEQVAAILHLSEAEIRSALLQAP